MLAFFGLIGEDRRKLAMMGPIFFAGGVAELLIYTAYMALFNLRFGVEYLPMMYIIETVIIPLEGWLLAYVASRISKPKLMKMIYYITMGTVFINGFILVAFKVFEVDFWYYYPILFLSTSFVIRQNTLLLWSTAFDLCPTQQAKRLMPLFVALAIIGGIIAGLMAQFLGPFIGTEYLYLLGPVILLAGLWNIRESIQRYLVPLTLKEQPKERVQEGEEAESTPSSMYYVKRMFKSPFLLCAVGLMTLLPALYYLMEYQYFFVSQAVFTDEQELTAFYGLMITLLFTAAFLLQLVSGKLMNWLGASNMLIAISVVYILGFGLAALLMDTRIALIGVSFGFAILYLLLYYFVDPCTQLFFKMLPLSQRDGFRFVAQGLATSGGVFIGACLSLLHSTGIVTLTIQAVLGIACAVIMVLLAWYTKSLYVHELIQSMKNLSSNMSEVVSEFLGSIQHAKLVQEIHQLLKHSSEYVREIAIELLGRSRDVAHLPVLLEHMGNGSSRIKLAALQAMNIDRLEKDAFNSIASLLTESEPEVRAQAIKRLATAKHMHHSLAPLLRQRLSDSSPRVVAEAIKAIYAMERNEDYPACHQALERLFGLNEESQAIGTEVVEQCKLSIFMPQVKELLGSTLPAIRGAAVKCLTSLHAVDVIPTLLELLPGADQELQQTIADSLIMMDTKAAPQLEKALQHEHLVVWKTAVEVLSRIWSTHELSEKLIPACISKLIKLEQLDSWVEGLMSEGEASPLTILADQRRREIYEIVIAGAWCVLTSFTDERTVMTLRRAIADEDEEIQESGLEVLAEGIGDRRLATALLQTTKQYIHLQAIGRNAENDVLSVVIKQKNKLQSSVQIKAPWPDDWLKEIAVAASPVDKKAGEVVSDMIEEHRFLSMLDKIVFLKQVPFFSTLSLDELGYIAGIAKEEIFQDQSYLLRRGEIHQTMYVIIDGNIELSSISTAGWEGTIGVLGAKEVCGDTTIFEEAPAAVTAQALLGEVRVLAIKGSDLAQVVRLYPEIGIGLLRASGARVRLLENMIMKLG